jgi:2-polyprenyl-6-methoxyphenol hydroxylase-like FAD-dependent oxidoreductase
MHTVGRHAVVIGASMAGLLTARVLTEAYDHLTIVERDIQRVVICLVWHDFEGA